MSFLEELGIEESTWKEAEAQTVNEGFKPIESGVYKATIKELGQFKTDNGAVMLKAKIALTDLIDHEIDFYQNIKKKNGEDNPIGVASLKHILEALNVSASEIGIKNGEIEAYGKKREAKLITGVTGKPFLAFVRQVHEAGAKYENYNEVEGFARIDGTNAKGEDIATKYKEKIEKTPILERKAKSGNDKKESETKSKAKADIDDLI